MRIAVRGAQLVRRHRGEVTGRGQGGLGATLLGPDPLQQALERLADLDGLGGPADVDIGFAAAGVDLAVC